MAFNPAASKIEVSRPTLRRSPARGLAVVDVERFGDHLATPRRL